MANRERAKAWFELLEAGAPLRQGDVLLEVVPSGGDHPPLDLIVLNQSCDLEARGGQPPNVSVLLAPCPSLANFLAARPSYYYEPLEGVRLGRVYDLYLLPPCVTSADSRLHCSRVVTFGEIFSRPCREIMEWVSRRQRAFALQPPYREHFSQAVARYFMRVGLPIDMPKFAFRAVEEPSTVRIAAGTCPWPSGPQLRDGVKIRVERTEDNETGDSLVVARLEGTTKQAVGLGADQTQAQQSLWFFLRQNYEDLMAGTHKDASSWQWLRDLFTG